MRRFLATATTAAVLSAGGAAAAAATDPAPDRSAATEAGGARSGGMRARVLREAVRIAAETIGVEPSDLVEAVRGGKSAAELATEHGVEPSAVVDALLTAANDAIDRAVAGGKIDEERAATLREKAPQLAERLVNATSIPGGGRGQPGQETQGAGRAGLRRQAIQAALEVAAQTIGVETDSLRDAYRDGRSIAEVATDHGVEPSAVVDAIVAAAGERIDQAVADGKLDAERAAKLRERVPQLAERLVNARKGDRAPRQTP